MLVQQLLKKQQLKLTVLTEQGQLQHELLQTRKRQLVQSSRAFIGSPPGLAIWGVWTVYSYLKVLLSHRAYRPTQPS